MYEIASSSSLPTHHVKQIPYFFCSLVLFVNLLLPSWLTAPGSVFTDEDALTMGRLVTPEDSVTVPPAVMVVVDAGVAAALPMVAVAWLVASTNAIAPLRPPTFARVSLNFGIEFPCPPADGAALPRSCPHRFWIQPYADCAVFFGATRPPMTAVARAAPKSSKVFRVVVVPRSAEAIVPLNERGMAPNSSLVSTGFLWCWAVISTAPVTVIVPSISAVALHVSLE